MITHVASGPQQWGPECYLDACYTPVPGGKGVVGISPAALYRLYLARERLREGVALQGDPSPLGRMKGMLALDDAVELILITLLPVLNVTPKRTDSLADLLKALVNARPALGSHSGPLERLRRLRDRVKHDGVVPSSEELRLNAVEAESFARAAVPAATGLTLEETSPIDAIEQDDLKAHLLAARTKLEEGDYVQVSVEASQAFALGRQRFAFKTQGFGRKTAERTTDELMDYIARAAERGAGRARDSGVSSFAHGFASALRNDRFHIRKLFEPLELPANFTRMGIDLAEFERFERLTPHVVVQSRGDWCQVSMTRDLTPTKDDAFFVLDFATRSLLTLQDRRAHTV